MKLNIYALFDSQIAAFAQPYFSPTNGSALRAFSDHVNDKNSPVNKHPGDYSVYQLGSYDDQTGEIQPVKPARIGTAVEYLNKE